MRPLAFSHSCLVTCLGQGKHGMLEAMRDGSSGLAPCRFETVAIDTFVGEVPDVGGNRIDGPFAAYDCRNNRLAAMALRQDGFMEAVAAAREKYGPRRIGVFLGTSTSGIHEAELAYRHRDPQSGALLKDFEYSKTHNTFSVAAFVRDYFGLQGPAIVVSSACASSTKAFGNAARMIEAGLCDAAIVGGADSLCLTTLYGFHSLALTSPAPCRPFDAERDGISIGEGAGFVLVEKADAAGDAEAILLGVGESSDAYHMSSPHPEGLGAKLAMERALGSAGLEARDIGYVKLHGTATPIGDAAEDRAVFGLFGPETPCSSLKGYIGHTLGASGVLEAIMAALLLQNGFMPGSHPTRAIDPAMASHHLAQRLDLKAERIACNSFGFGGSNCSLIMGRA